MKSKPPRFDDIDKHIEAEAMSRVMPSTELDMQMLTTNSVWGQPEVSQELKERLARWYKSINEDGETIINKESLWGMLGYFTRDMRLANLSAWDNEIQTVRYYLELAHDLLDSDMPEPFVICLSRSAGIMETSQSKGGFLRRLFNTFRKEEYSHNAEPPKKGFFGGKKDGGGYQ